VFRGDVLSDVLDQIDVRGVMTGGFAVRGPWVSRGAVSRPLKIIALVAGSATLTVDGPGGPDGPVDLAPGDVVLLNGRTFLDVRGGIGEGVPEEQIPVEQFDSRTLTAADRLTDDVLVGGRIDVSPAGRALLGAALPGLLHIRAAAPAATRAATLVDRLFEEAASQRLGSAFAIRQNAQLLLLEVLRAHLAQDRPSIGWLRLLTDERLAPAIALMHGEPGRAWGLVELAAAASMSRTTFADRFRTIAGVPPLEYLTRWRMLIAQRALRDPDVRIGTLAAELGYGSDSAFSTAFKREIGVSPLHYRQRARPS
jgi:AraC-like DNA-binding protein